MTEQEILEEKIEAAKKDLEEWKSFDGGTYGQLHPDDLGAELCHSCKLIGVRRGKDGLVYCRSKKYGKCIFYCCNERQSYLEWRNHHKKFHPEDNDVLCVSCNECRILRDKEIGFRNDAISNAEIELNQVKLKGERDKSLADIAKKRNL